MSDWDRPSDPPGGWQRKHLHRYLATGGRDGHLFHSAPTLLLTTLGRRTGKARRTPLIYGRDGEDYLVVGSNGGAPDHPSWYRNLAARPQVRVQVHDQVFDAVARTAGPAERARLWPVMTGIWPAYEDYQRKTSREIPVVIISRA